MKKKSIIIWGLSLLVIRCSSDSVKEQRINWIKRDVLKYTLKIPAKYSIVYSKDSLSAVIQGGNIKIDFISGDFRIARFTNSKLIISESTISSFKRVILDSATNNSSTIAVALWDTTTGSNLVNYKRYYGCILGANNLSDRQKYIVVKIFNSLKPKN